MNAPEWLTLRDGTIKAGVQAHSLFVLLSGKPQYRLDARPAKNQYSCSVIQTVNGKQIDVKAGYTTLDAAFVGGLDQLREKLGW